MKQSYLEVTYRRGRLLAAYYHLPHRFDRRVWRSRETAPGLVLDVARNGDPMGIEITEPTRVTLASMNRVLRGLGLPLLRARDWAPMRAA